MFNDLMPQLSTSPQFLGIGAQKAGTTWLFTHLQTHPDVSFPAGKEIHFWDLKRNQGVQWWLALFANSRGKIQGEITPAYAILDRETIQQIHSAVPDVRLFYSMRNPIRRAWSQALMCLERAEMTIDEASDRWFLDHFNSLGSRRRGDYEACLDRWLSVFPESQLHTILFDDIVSNPRAVLADLAQHLKIDREPFDWIPEDKLRRPVQPLFSGQRFAGQHHSLRPTLHDALRWQYRPQIERLGERIGRDLSVWLE
jgi:hypothetical protein